MNAKAGTICSLEVERNGQVIESREIHNLPSNDFFTGVFYIYGDMGVSLIDDSSSPFKSELDGTFSQSGNVITRESGSGSLDVSDGALLVFEDGSFSYAKSLGSETQCESSKTQDVLAQKLYKYNTGDLEYYNAMATRTISSRSARNQSLENGKFIADYANFPEIFTANNDFTLSLMTIYDESPQIGSFYIVDPAIQIQSGDIIKINSYRIELEIRNGKNPISFTAEECPLKGFSHSGRYQWFDGISQTVEGLLHDNSNIYIILLDESNKVAFQDPPELSFNSLSDSISETLLKKNAVTAVKEANASNNRKAQSVVRTYNGSSYAITGVKQLVIAYDDSRYSSRSDIYFVVEFDQAIEVPGFSNLEVHLTSQVEPDVPIP